MSDKNKYFFICEHCGAIDWLEEIEGEESLINSLQSDGGLLFGVKREIPYFGAYCTNCEAKLIPLSFKEVPLQTRKKIYKMTEEERINWVKGFQIVRKLKEEKEGYKEFYY